MSTEKDYTPEEWTRIASAPAVAGTLIITADPALFGAIKESAAIAKAINQFGDTSEVELIRTIGAAARQGQKFQQPEVPKDKGMEGALNALVKECHQAALIVEKKSPEEAAAYSQYLVDVAEVTAESSKEGGFLGIGATRVSGQEIAALKKLAEALGVPLEDAADDGS